jgi:hypothetical protein
VALQSAPSVKIPKSWRRFRPMRLSIKTPAKTNASTANNKRGPIENPPMIVKAVRPPQTAQIRLPHCDVRSSPIKTTANMPARPKSATSMSTSAGRGQIVAPRKDVSSIQKRIAIPIQITAPTLASIHSAMRLARTTKSLSILSYYCKTNSAFGKIYLPRHQTPVHSGTMVQFSSTTFCANASPKKKRINASASTSERKR